MKFFKYFYLFFIFFFFELSTLISEQKFVLVTGGAGYIGSHTCKVLKDAGFVPVAFDSLEYGEEEAVKWGPLVVGNLLDLKALERVFEVYKPCAVIHFAGLRNVRDSVKDPSSYYTNNVTGSINLLNTMLKYNIKNLIFSSSCTVYGETLFIPISEDSPKNPTNPYARSKFFVENIISDYALAYQFKYMILRYFNAAGLGFHLKRSKHSFNFLIPKALLSLLENTPMEIFGFDYPTKDGTCIRDYIHVKDLARAHVLALEHLMAGRDSKDLNLGTGKGYSVLEIINTIEGITGKKVPYRLNARKAGDVPEAVAKVDRAKEVLDFETQYSDLSNIIESEWVSLLKYK